MRADEARRQVEELMGRRDALQGEIQQAQHDVEKFSSLNELVAAREAQAERQRLQQRFSGIERQLHHLRQYW